MNTQPVEKISRNPSGDLDVHSIFYTIQGEGPFVGQPAIFLRLAGCNLQCPMCDTDYTSKRFLLTPQEVVDSIKLENRAATLVVITGGEPFRQNLTPAVCAILAAGYRVQIETNGTLHLDGFPYDMVTLVVSPKTGSIAPRLIAILELPWAKNRPHEGAAHNAFKYVARACDIQPDGLPLTALEHPTHPELARPPEGFAGLVYLQPADEIKVFPNLVSSFKDAANRINLEAVRESCLTHGYTMGVQLHKIINVE